MRKEDLVRPLLELFRDYRHYKQMSSGLFKGLFRNYGISLLDFIEWLDSRR